MRNILIIASAVLLCTCSRPPTLLEEVRALGELRVVTRNSETTYYTDKAGPEGPDYDLVRGFAEHLGVQLTIIEADRFGDLLTAVESGKAHMAAAGLTVTAERARRVDFSPPYQEVRQHVVYRRGRDAPRDIADLKGKRIEVVAQSSYVNALEEARGKVPELAWTEDPGADAAELLGRVARGEIDYTIVDSNIFAIFQSRHPEVRVAFDMTSHDALAWAFPRRGDRSLVDEAAAYLASVRSSGRLAQIMDRYYGHNESFDYAGNQRFNADYASVLPGFRQYFKDAEKRTDIDWRLVAAIGYQESRWDPDAVSPKGAGGIMMLTPDTALLMDIEDPADAAQSIMGGAKYLWRMRNRIAKLAPDVPEPDLTWMTLAAYNMGYGHLLDARRITELLGRNPDRWVDVRDSLPLLMKRQWYSKARWGYARGEETIAYVRNIRNYYDTLRFLTEKAPDAPATAKPVVGAASRKVLQDPLAAANRT